MARKPKTPPYLPLTPEEVAFNEDIARKLQQMGDRLRQRNLDNAVVLAQEAARGQGPLVDHFSELGRRYAHTLNKLPKPKLRVVKGGAT